ncbi:RNA helicase [Pedobacter psychrophilus]|uniref:RNA helicase n=1 Tax=Pedobacter psychrophilus TaxID=1826909 RepID=A0A179DS09_9SPHI|nr:DEAD/DEAH box helicase [Pedobacter psychrophilus]OAQ43642.1 RNA helicase [Pedobacter psychrophilus]
MSFSSLGLPQYLLNNLEQNNLLTPTPIQEQAIPAILNNKDVLGIAKTGSGKTASFVLPILANLEKQPKLKDRHIAVLVLVPTRELALQVNDVFETFSKALPFTFKTMAVYGGTSVNVQMKTMSNVNILIATPGRLLDLISTNAVHLNEVKIFVVDEADKMLNLGFKKELDEIISLLPTKKQNLLFSATLNPNIEIIKRVMLNDPLIIHIASDENSVELINQTAYAVSPEKKGPLLRHLIDTKNMQQVLIFTSSIFDADAVVNKLNKNNIKAKSIHGKKSQFARTQALSDFKEGKLKVLVATDILSRGIDIKFLPFVINYDLPRSPKDYIHRIGRTGRSENPGEAISLITPEEEHHFKVIQKKMKMEIELIDAKDLKF